MKPETVIDCLEQNPVVAAIRDDRWEAALRSPAQVLFYLSAAAVVGVVVYLLFLVMFIMDDTLKSEEDCQNYLGISIIGEIPDADDVHKNKYGYYKRRGYGKYSSRYSPYKTYQAYQARASVENEKKEEEK